jgi:hypothetical protein
MVPTTVHKFWRSAPAGVQIPNSPARNRHYTDCAVHDTVKSCRITTNLQRKLLPPSSVHKEKLMELRVGRGSVAVSVREREWAEVWLCQ